MRWGVLGERRWVFSEGRRREGGGSGGWDGEEEGKREVRKGYGKGIVRER